ncbi:GNAT family N-acetyltransferase [Natrinema amylolyticum]|uniref:GNAT family N-acetyltransferase n=1 Tax=Natrinema amylolyticum TaxID=2878679 RepID=UPI001CFB5F71|nr:GNAT family N-acetyltransferase [Natrinema amylolyticum]
MTSRREPDRCSYWDNDECVGTARCPPRCPRFTDERGVPSLVRPYRTDDFEALAAMYEDFDESVATMGLPPFTRSRIEDWITELTSDGWNLVAVSSDRIVGHLAVTPASALDPEFVVFVHTDFQNRGIGEELLKQLVAYADAGGHEALRLTVANENQRAISVYENIGFETVDQSALNTEMQLSLERPLTDRVQRPPADRD